MTSLRHATPLAHQATPLIRHATLLGLLHGPAELLPISSSAHTTLLPWFANWPYRELNPELRKSFEVALHAGTAAALLWRPPWPSQGELHSVPESHGGPESQGVRASRSFMAAALLAPVLAGYTLGEHIERQLGTPGTIAAGLVLGTLGIAAGELRARGQNRTSPSMRDGLALGAAQALALMPGVSRSGATFAAARARGFSAADADRLSWSVGLPVIVGAALLKSVGLAREHAYTGKHAYTLTSRRTHKNSRPTHENASSGPHTDASSDIFSALALGGASAFLSTLASARILNSSRRRRLLPACLLYRTGLAALVIRRMRDNTS